MKTKFSVPQIAEIAKKVRTYKTLHVTTTGQMFRKQVDAEEAVRTLNMILDDTNDHVGILKVTDEMVSAEKLRTFGRSPKIFDNLFKDAKIPVSKVSEKKQHTRLREKPATDAKEVVNDVETALGIKKAAK